MSGGIIIIFLGGFWCFLYLYLLTLRLLMSYIYMEHPFLIFLDHTQRRSTVGRTPLDEWSAHRRDLYLTTHDTHNRQISMPPVGFEPTISAGERQPPQAPHTCIVMLIMDEVFEGAYFMLQTFWLICCLYVRLGRICNGVMVVWHCIIFFVIILTEIKLSHSTWWKYVWGMEV